MRRLILFFEMLLALGVVGLSATAQDSPAVGDLRSVTLADGGAGSYVLYTPTNLESDTPAPLLIALHGRMSNIRAMEATAHLNAQAEARGFRIAYVKSSGYSWQEGWKEAGVPRFETDPGDDVALLNAVEADISADVTVSDLYYVGYDTGGHMALRMMCERSGDIAGVVLVSSLPWSYWPQACPERLAAGRVLIIHGDIDTIHQPTGFDSPDIMLTDGSVLRQLGREELLSVFIERAGCVDAEAVEQLRVLTGCADGGDISLVTIPAGGHEWFHKGDYIINQAEADAGELIGDWLDGGLSAVTLLTRVPEGSVPRTGQLFLPSSYDGENPLPLVIGLHGRPDSGAGFALITEIDKVAEAEGFALAFPDGLVNQWNYLGDFVDNPQFHSPNDISYLESLIADLALDVNIDRQRVYLMGFSNGGFMTYRTACEVAHPFAGFGVLGALMYPEFEITCAYARPVPMGIFHGTQDLSINWEGLSHASPDGTMKPFSTRSVLESVGYWSAHNQCAIDDGVKTEYEPQVDSATQIIRFDFASCAEGAPVRFLAMVNAGHVWPGGTYLGHRFGNTPMDINAGQEIWEFLSQFHRDDL